MAANLTARQLRVFIGGDDQEWSFAAADFLPEQESFGESGLIKTFAQITLLDVLGNPESLDPRANPARWREGNMVRIDVATDAGGWFTWGNLRLLEIPSGPSSGRLTLQLGCWLAWADDPQPEGDRSDVTLGTGENSADLAARLLEASGIPPEAIALGEWDYDVAWPLQKEGGGSYVAQAGALAFANHCRQLYQDPDGIIRAEQWDATPGTSVATVTVGLNESLFEPTPDPVPPVERVVVSGVGYQVSTTPNRYSSSFTVTEPASNFSDDAIGTVGITTTEIYEWGEPDEDHDYYWTRSETRLRQPRCVTWIGDDNTQPDTTTTYEERRYDATTQILYRIEAGEIANVRTLVDSTVSAAGVTIVQRTITDLEHDAAAETLTRRTETTTVPRIQLTGDTGETGRFVQETARVLDTRWTEDRPDYWVERTSERVAAKNGSGRQGNIKPTALITQRPQIKPNSRPPATERWEDPTSLKEQHYTAECTWQHPGGATGRVRTRSLTVTPGFSNEQCFEIATREVRLLEGRRESYLIELPLADALLWLPPLSTIQVDDGTNRWTFRLDATTWEYALQEARLVAMGICVARVPVEVPVGTPLPEFESGLEPGQVAPEEPESFVPPLFSPVLEGDAAISVATVADAVLGVTERVEGEAAFATATVADAAIAGVGSVSLAGDAAVSTASVADGTLTGGVQLLGGDPAIALASVADGVLLQKDPNFANVSLLLHFDGANNSTTFTDSSPNAFTVTPFGNAKLSTTTPKFGTACGDFDGTGDYAQLAHNAAFSFGSGNFTIECWAWFPTVPTTFADGVIAAKWVGDVPGAQGEFIFTYDGTRLRFDFRATTGSYTSVQASASSISANTWTYLAVSRNGSTWTFNTGGATSTATQSATIKSETDPLEIGGIASGTTNAETLVRLDELRITKGVARTVTSVPTDPFPSN